MPACVFAVVLILVALVQSAPAEGPSGMTADIGLDLLAFSNSDLVRKLGWSRSNLTSNLFEGLNLRVGYRFGQPVGLMGGFRYFIPKQCSRPSEFGTVPWNQHAFNLAANIFPFRNGDFTPFYLICGVEMVQWNCTFSALDNSSGSETDLRIGIGFSGADQVTAGWEQGIYFEIADQPGDYGGVLIELGARGYFRI